MQIYWKKDKLVLSDLGPNATKLVFWNYKGGDYLLNLKSISGWSLDYEATKSCSRITIPTFQGNLHTELKNKTKIYKVYKLMKELIIRDYDLCQLCVAGNIDLDQSFKEFFKK